MGDDGDLVAKYEPETISLGTQKLSAKKLEIQGYKNKNPIDSQFQSGNMFPLGTQKVNFTHFMNK